MMIAWLGGHIRSSLADRPEMSVGGSLGCRLVSRSWRQRIRLRRRRMTKGAPRRIMFSLYLPSVQIRDLEKRLATVENELKNEKEEKKTLKRLTNAHKWIHNARWMRLQQMFDGMSTEMWDAKKKETEDEKKKKDDQGCSKDMVKK
jgi:hypothetical protein